MERYITETKGPNIIKRPCSDASLCLCFENFSTMWCFLYRIILLMYDEVCIQNNSRLVQLVGIQVNAPCFISFRVCPSAEIASPTDLFHIYPMYGVFTSPGIDTR